MNIWDEIIKAGELQKLKKEAKADIIPVLKVLLDTDTVRMKDVIELCEAHGVSVDATLNLLKFLHLFGFLRFLTAFFTAVARVSKSFYNGRSQIPLELFDL